MNRRHRSPRAGFGQIDAACLATVTGLPIASACYWSSSTPSALAGQWTWDPTLLADLGGPERLWGFALSGLALVPLCHALQATRTLVRLYAAGEAFTDRTVLAFSHIGRSVVWFGLAQLLVPTLIPLALTIGQPVGQRLVVVSASALLGFGTMILGALLLLVSRITVRARDIAAEHALTV